MTYKPPEFDALRQLNVVRTNDGRFQVSHLNEDGSSAVYVADDPTNAIRGVYRLLPVVVMCKGTVQLIVFHDCCAVWMDFQEMVRGSYNDCLAAYKVLIL